MIMTMSLNNTYAHLTFIIFALWCIILMQSHAPPILLSVSFKLNRLEGCESGAVQPNCQKEKHTLQFHSRLFQGRRSLLPSKFSVTGMRSCLYLRYVLWLLVSSLSHDYQGSIDFNTVSINCTIRVDFLIFLDCIAVPLFSNSETAAATPWERVRNLWWA